MDLAGIAAAQEDGFGRGRAPEDGAPLDAADAIDNYRRVLSIVGKWRPARSPRTPSLWITKEPSERRRVRDTEPGMRESLRRWRRPI